MKNARISLDQAYIDQVKQNVSPHWGELGWVTYKRTYARWLPEYNRAEEWDGTCGFLGLITKDVMVIP